MQGKQESFETNLTSAIDTVVDSKLKPIQTEITTMKNSSESKIGEVLSQLNNLQANQATVIATVVTNTMTAFYQKVPISRAELLSGVNP